MTCRTKLAQKGWMVPAYTMPANIEAMVVMRVLCKQGFSRDMADQLIADINFAVADLNKLVYPTNTRIALEKNAPLKLQFSITQVDNRRLLTQYRARHHRVTCPFCCRHQ